MRIPKVLLHPPQKMDFWPKTCQILPKFCIFGHLEPNIDIFGHFGPNTGIFGPFDPMPDQKQCKQGAQVVFRFMGAKTFTFSRKNWDFGPKMSKFG